MNNCKRLPELPKLESERLILRKIILEDALDIFEYAHVPEVAEFLPWFPHQSIQDSIEFIKFTEEKFESDEWIILGIELKENRKTDRFNRYSRLKGVNNCADIGYVISKNFWGKGMMTEALKEVIKYCFDELADEPVEAHCEEANIGSWKVMKKCGMKNEGTLREKVFVKIVIAQ